MQVYVPSKIREALELRNEHDPSFFLGGGTLVNGTRWKRSGSLISLSRLALDGVDVDGDRCVLGAMTTLGALQRAPQVESFGLHLLLRAVKDLQRINIRNAATLGGAVASNQPFSDTLPALLVLDTSLEVQASADGTSQEISIGDFLSKKAKERPLITRILLPRPKDSDRFGMARLARNAGDIPCAKVACRLRLDGATCSEARLAVGLSGVPVHRLEDGEARLTGSTIDEAVVTEVAKAAAEAVKPVADLRGGSEFKRTAFRTLVTDALLEALGKGGEAR